MLVFLISYKYATERTVVIGAVESVENRLKVMGRGWLPVRLAEDNGSEKRGKRMLWWNVHSFLHARRWGKCGKYWKWFLMSGLTCGLVC
jgi:hypothetical protein